MSPGYRDRVLPCVRKVSTAAVPYCGSSPAGTYEVPDVPPATECTQHVRKIEIHLNCPFLHLIYTLQILTARCRAIPW